MECQWQHIGIMTIYVDTSGNIFVTQKLKALYHGDNNYCQSQGSKKIKDKILFLILGRSIFFVEV